MVDHESPMILRPSGTGCNSLLKELQQIWDDIGETRSERDRLLMELDEECMNVYRKKVDEAATTKARLHHALAAKEAEIATLMAALGEANHHSQQIQPGKKSVSLKEQLSVLSPVADELRRRRDERIKQFSDMKALIQKISAEMSEYFQVETGILATLDLNEQDLSIRHLNEYETHLRLLQKEKSTRLNKVLEYVNEVHCLCGVLALDFGETVRDVHPSLEASNDEHSTNISDKTLQGLEQTITKLKRERKSRFEKLKEAMVLLSGLWNLMDTPETERSYFSRIALVLRYSDDEDVTQGDVLSMDLIHQVTDEVQRLTTLKAGKMKEIVMRRRMELEEICRSTHTEPDSSTDVEKLSAMIDSGLVDPSELLANMEDQVMKAKQEAISRKEVTDRIDRWLAVCEEENWLEEYNMDENRYSAVRGAHLNLKRAERARVSVSKIPAMVDNLITRTLAWEDENGKPFLYDGIQLVTILEDYKLTRQQKEEDKRRGRDQKKLHDILTTEKESIFGSKPSPRKSNSFRKPTNGYHHRANGNGSMAPAAPPRRRSIGSPRSVMGTPHSYSSGYQNGNGYFKESRRNTNGPLNFVSMVKEDTLSSYASISGSEPGSPLKL